MLDVLLSIALFAPPPQQPHVVVAPACLVRHVTAPYKTLAANHSLLLIQVQDDGIDQLIAAKQLAPKPCGGFMDVTAHKEATEHPMRFLSKTIKTTQHTIDYQIKYSRAVHTLINQLNSQAMWDNLTYLTHYDDRYAASDNGIKTAAWLKEQVDTFINTHQRHDVSAYFVATGAYYRQPSLVVKIGEGESPGIVIGAHMDTLSSKSSIKPGADDDGTGTVTVLEIARILLSGDMRFHHPIYLIWYAAEEEGLIGSGFVVNDFQHRHIPVRAALQFDMTGYAPHNEQTMWLISDYVDRSLTAYLESLITTYVQRPVQYTRCGYACSDHASWTLLDVPSAFPFESAASEDNPYIHTAQDTLDKISLAHMTDYAKLGLAFAVEMAEPKE